MLFRTVEAMWEEITRFRQDLPRAGARIALLVEGAKSNAYMTFDSVKFSLEPQSPPLEPWEAAREIAFRFGLDVKDHEPWGSGTREVSLNRGPTTVARLRHDKLFIVPSAADLPLFRELVRLYTPWLVPEKAPPQV